MNSILNLKIITLLILVLLLDVVSLWADFQIENGTKHAVAADSYSFPTESGPGVYLSFWPKYTIAFPSHWEVKKPEPGLEFKAESPNGIQSIRVSFLPANGKPLKHFTDFLVDVVSQSGTEIEILELTDTRLSDGTPAQEMEVSWNRFSNTRHRTVFLSVLHADNWLTVSVTDLKSDIDDSLKKYLYSLRFRPKNRESTNHTYSVPEQTDDGWLTDHAANVNLDPRSLEDLIDNIKDNTYQNVHSVIVVKNGKLILEAYFEGMDFRGNKVPPSRESLHVAASVTKSFSSTLIGLAIDHGFIKGTNQELNSFFPEMNNHLITIGDKKILLHHVLAMNAGFKWDEISFPYFDIRNSWTKLIKTAREDQVNFILSRPLTDEPGVRFTYNSGMSVLLGVILERSSGMKFREFTEKYLFDPLNISDYKWVYGDQSETIPTTDGGLQISPRSMAKLGYLMINKGKWNGKTILSPHWVDEATKLQVSIYPQRAVGYGYHWWKYRFRLNGKVYDAPTATGWGGQNIFTLPDLDLVVVFTCGNYKVPNSQSLNMIFHMMNAHILKSLN